MPNSAFNINPKWYTLFGQWEVNGNMLANLSAVTTTLIGAAANGFPAKLALYTLEGTTALTSIIVGVEFCSRNNETKIILTDNARNALLYGAGSAFVTGGLVALLSDDDPKTNEAQEAVIAGLTGVAIESAIYSGCKLLGWGWSKYQDYKNGNGTYASIGANATNTNSNRNDVDVEAQIPTGSINDSGGNTSGAGTELSKLTK